MIKLKELLEQKEYKIYLDMDGVLTDFDEKFRQMFDAGNPRDFERKHGTEEFWNLVDQGKIWFWSKMPWTKDGKRLWGYLVNKDVDVFILSAPSKRLEYSEKGKKIWVNRELGNVPVFFRPKERKAEFSCPNCILIDDTPENVKMWKSKGGIGILHKSAADTIKKLKELGV